MRSPRAATGAPRGAGCGGGRTRSTGAGCARSTRRARADQDLAVSFDGDYALLILRKPAQHADAALVLGLVELLGHGPFGGQRVAGPYRVLETARGLELPDPRARDIHADRRGDQRAGERSVEDAAAEARLARELLVDVQRIGIAERAGAQPAMRFGAGDARAEAVADADLVVPLAREQDSLCVSPRTTKGRISQ